MEDNRKYAIAKGNLEFFQEIAKRDKIPAEFVLAKNGNDYVMVTPITKGVFLDMLEEAKGMRNTKENHKKTPMYGHRILKNPELFRRCREYNGTPCFRISKKESKLSRKN